MALSYLAPHCDFLSGFSVPALMLSCFDLRRLLLCNFYELAADAPIPSAGLDRLAVDDCSGDGNDRRKIVGAALHGEDRAAKCAHYAAAKAASGCNRCFAGRLCRTQIAGRLCSATIADRLCCALIAGRLCCATIAGRLCCALIAGRLCSTLSLRSFTAVAVWGCPIQKDRRFFRCSGCRAAARRSSSAVRRTRRCRAS